MSKEKAPKPIVRFDPKNDPLKRGVITPRRPAMAELILALKVASCANEHSGGAAWGIDSPFQKKIESLVGPRPYGDVNEPTKPESTSTEHREEGFPFPSDEQGPTRVSLDSGQNDDSGV